MLTTSSSGSHDDEEVWQAEEREVKNVVLPSSSSEWQIQEEVCDDHIYIPAKFMSEDVSCNAVQLYGDHVSFPH